MNGTKQTTSHQPKWENIDARGEQAAADNNTAVEVAKSAPATPGSASYDPEIWNLLPAASGALQ